jgi:hypothetical protein
MKAATLKELKTELSNLPKEELLALCLHLSKYKKENKEMLSYLVFESHQEKEYIEGVKKEIEALFEIINTSSFYLIKKSIRKILRHTKKHIIYSKKKETEVDLLIHFCIQLAQMKPSFKNNTTLDNMYNRILESIQKTVRSMHDDLQYDYKTSIEQLKSHR